MTKVEQYLARVGGWRAFFIIALVIFFFFISKITEPVLNFNNETQTVIYAQNDFVPPAYVNSNHLLLGFILLAGLVMTFIGKDTQKPEIATIDEVNEIIEGYMKKRKSIETEAGTIIEIGEYNISNNFFLRELREGTESKPYRYVVQINVKDKANLPHYLKANVHPYSRYISEFIEIEKPLEAKDRCPECGEEFDVAYINTEDVKKLKAVKEAQKE